MSKYTLPPDLRFRSPVPFPVFTVSPQGYQPHPKFKTLKFKAGRLTRDEAQVVIGPGIELSTKSGKFYRTVEPVTLKLKLWHKIWLFILKRFKGDDASVRVSVKAKAVALDSIPYSVTDEGAEKTSG